MVSKIPYNIDGKRLANRWNHYFHLWSYVWFPRTIYGLTYGFQEPFMVLRIVSKNHLWSYVWFPRTIYGLTYGFQESFMVLHIIYKNHLWSYVWFTRSIKKFSVNKLSISLSIYISIYLGLIFQENDAH